MHAHTIEPHRGKCVFGSMHIHKITFHWSPVSGAQIFVVQLIGKQNKHNEKLKWKMMLSKIVVEFDWLEEGGQRVFSMSVYESLQCYQHRSFLLVLYR